MASKNDPDADAFQRELTAYVSQVGNKSAAAKQLKITRPDLYRYLGGKTTPRLRRRTRLLHEIAPARPPRGLEEYTESLDPKHVALLRKMLVHLLHVVELDGRAHGRDEYGAESARERRGKVTDE